jgi:hypothetical protein
MRISMLLTIALTLGAGTVHPQDEKKSPDRPLVVELKATKDSYPAGTVPTFRLTIRNRGKVAEKVLKLRGDLQDTYFDLEVFRNGKSVSLVRAISDPGPISDDDFMKLQPGEALTYDLTRFAVDLTRLPVGSYSAVVRYHRRPTEPFENAERSSEAKFEIK